MANLTWQDIITSCRLLAAEPSVNGRYPDAELTNYINMAMEQTMIRVGWPEATWSVQTDGVTKEWKLPELYSLLRVYVAGQICLPKTIPILEGRALGVYDDSTVNFNPRWTQAPFTGYPVAGIVSTPVSQTVPYFQGQRPSFYTRGSGILGVVPPVAAGATIALDVYPAPAPLVDVTSPPTFFPQLFKEGIAARTLMYASLAGGVATGEDVKVFYDWFEDQVMKVLLPFKSNFVEGLPNTPMVVPHRTYWMGPPRTPRGRGSRFGA